MSFSINFNFNCQCWGSFGLMRILLNLFPRNQSRFSPKTLPARLFPCWNQVAKAFSDRGGWETRRKQSNSPILMKNFQALIEQVKSLNITIRCSQFKFPIPLPELQSLKYPIISWNDSWWKFFYYQYLLMTHSHFPGAHSNLCYHMHIMRLEFMSEELSGA
jgi:hypothetical protein